MSAVALIIVGTIALAVVLATLLPGAGFIGAIVVVVIGLAVVRLAPLCGRLETGPQ